MSSDDSNDDLQIMQDEMDDEKLSKSQVKSGDMNDSFLYMTEALPRSPLVSPDDRMFSGSVLPPIVNYNDPGNKLGMAEVPISTGFSTFPHMSIVKDQEHQSLFAGRADLSSSHIKNKAQKSYASGPLKMRPPPEIRTSLSNMGAKFPLLISPNSSEIQPIVPAYSYDVSKSDRGLTTLMNPEEQKDIKKVTVSFGDVGPGLTEMKQTENLRTDIFYKFPNFETKNLINVPLSDEDRKKPSPPRKSIFQKLIQTPLSRSIVRCVDTNGFSTEVSKKALGLVEDKAFYQKESGSGKKLYSRHMKSIPRLTRLLRKHAATGTLKRTETGMLSVIDTIQLMKMNVFQRLKAKISNNLERIRNNLSLIRIMPKHQLKPFRPDDPFRVFWDIMTLMFIMYDLIVMPFELSFGIVEGNFLLTMDIIVTIFFLLDIIVSFHTAHYVDGVLVFSRKETRRAYLHGWFWADLIASFPYQWTNDNVEDPNEDQTAYFNRLQGRYLTAKSFLRLIKLVRFIRVVKLKKIVEKLHGSFDIHNQVIVGAINLLKLCLFITFLAHWCACGWYMFVLGSDGENYLAKLDLDESSLDTQYITTLYYTLTIMLTVGFGDITPQNKKEKIYSMFVMLLGGCVFGYVMNYIGIIVYSLEDEKSKVMKKVSSLSKYMQKEGLAKDVQHDVKKYLEFLFESEKKIKETDKDLINMLSTDLKGRVYEQINGKLVYGNSVLMENFSKKFLYQITGKIEERTYVPGEKVFEVSDTECCIYFVSKGTIDFYLPKCHNIALSLNKGDHFGEVAFFTQMPRTLTAKSENYSRLLILNRDKFLEALNGFPLDKEIFCMIRDKILFYNDLSSLKLKCSGCDEENHVLEVCPQIRFAPNKESVIRAHLNKIKQFKKGFTRRNRIKFHPRESLDELQTEAENLAEKYPSEVSEIQEANKFEEEDREEEEPSVQSDQQSSVRSPGKTASFIRGVQVLSSFVKKGRKRSNTISVNKDQNVKNVWMALYNLHAEGLKALRRNLTEIGITEVNPDLIEVKPVLVNNDEDNFEFDKVQNYQMYFHYNNITKIQDRINLKKKFLAQQSDEILNLRTHLKRFFIAFEKRKSKAPKSLPGKSGFTTSLANSYYL